MPASRIPVYLRSGKKVQAPIVRPVRKEAPRYTSVKSTGVLVRAQGRALAAGARMQDRLAQRLLDRKISRDEYDIYRAGIQKKLTRSIEMKASQIKRISERDPKFGVLFKHSFFLESAEEMLRSKKNASVVIIDIDHFKAINDSLGHGPGDVVLRFLAIHIAATAKKMGGFAGRFGGEEFEVMLPKGKAAAVKFIKELARTAGKDFKQNEVMRSLLSGRLFTFSAGISEKSERESFEQMFKLADERMYIAKRAGRNRVVYHDDPAHVRRIR